MHSPPPCFKEGLRRLSLEMPPGQLDLLGRYLGELLDANKQFNLTAIRDPDEAWVRHILDSLTLLPLLGEAASVADIGSGGGLPGIPLAIMRPQTQFLLVEATGKKARFIESTASELGLTNVSVGADRAETLGHDPAYREHYSVVTGRALGPLPVFLELTVPFAMVNGRVLAQKGHQAPSELESAERALKELGVDVIAQHRPLQDDAVILELSKKTPTAAIYPRLPGTPKKQPL